MYCDMENELKKMEILCLNGNENVVYTLNYNH
jgi:hypothetical protein